MSATVLVNGPAPPSQRHLNRTLYCRRERSDWLTASDEDTLGGRRAAESQRESQRFDVGPTR
jgi:hypothetical protein